MNNADSQPLRRPLTITVATVCLAISLAAGLVTWIFTMHWREPLVPVVYALACGIVFFLVRGIYLGRSWARWLTIIFIVLGLIRTPAYLAHFSGIQRVRFIVQAVL